MTIQPAMRFSDELGKRRGEVRAVSRAKPKNISLDRTKLPSNVVKSAGRVMQILEYFDDVQCPSNAIEVARALGIPQSSASMLLRSLVALGYLRHDPVARTYQPTSRVGLMGSWVEPSLLRCGALVELMRDLNGATGITVVLAARNGLQAQYIHVEQAETVVGVRVPVGATHPIAVSAASPIFLSALSDNEVAKLVRRINAYALAGDPLIRVNDMYEFIRQFRRDRYVFRPCELNPGFSVLAVPLKSEVERSPLVLALAGPDDRMDRLEFLLHEVRTRLDAHFKSTAINQDARLPRHSPSSGPATAWRGAALKTSACVDRS